MWVIGSFKVIENVTIRRIAYEFLFYLYIQSIYIYIRLRVQHTNTHERSSRICTVFETESEILVENASFHTPFHLTCTIT